MNPGRDLFAGEEAVIEAAEAELARAGSGEADPVAALETLLAEYRKLFRITRRMIRLSDRNERELNAMAEERRLAAEEVSRKNQELETLSAKLAKYLSPQVYGSIFSGRQEVKLASRREKLTVFFSDISGFTELTDRMESEDLTRLLNLYLTEMSRVALEHGATIDKYVGDAIMIFFGDPETRGVREDALACVRMAIAMQECVRRMEVEWQHQGAAGHLACRMGINTGYCTVGNFGSEDRMDYTIIGGTVNVASRLEHEAGPGEILLSYETWAHVRDEIDCEEVGSIRVKGVAYPVVAYRVLGVARQGSAKDRLEIDTPHFRLSLDPVRMTSDERRRGSEILRRALSSLEKGS